MRILNPPAVPSLMLIIALVMSGCAVNDDPTKDWSAERFYTEGKAALDTKDYTTAIKNFETLDARYPYGAYAEQAQLETAYAYYKDDEPESAIAAADRFIRLHPTHPHVDYAYYLKGLANFNEQNGIFDKIRGKEDLSDRDPKAAREAFNAFHELVTQFPKSAYASDAAQRMHHLVNTLAKYEIHVAEYYYMRGAYVAAANRGQYVVEHYQQTPLLEDALGIEAKSYKMMGMNKLAEDAIRVLKENFPHSTYLSELQTLSVKK